MVFRKSSEGTAVTGRKREVALRLLAAMDAANPGKYSMQSTPLAIREVRPGGRNHDACLDNADGCGLRPCGLRPCNAHDGEAAQNGGNFTVSISLTLLSTLVPLLSPLAFLTPLG